MNENALGMVEHSRTLWKICRAASNPLRLRMLKLIYTSQDDLNESKIRRLLDIDQSVASIYLNQLCVAGLIGAERDGVKVYFRAAAREGFSEEFSYVLTQYFNDHENDPEWMDDLLTVLKPYAHFNRLAMLCRLIDGPATKDELLESAGKVVRTIEHHLRILVSAGLIRTKRRYHAPMTIELAPPYDPVSAVMMMFVEELKRSGEDFKNVITWREFDEESRRVMRNFILRDGLDWETPRKQRAKSRRFTRQDRAAHDEPNHDVR